MLGAERNLSCVSPMWRAARIVLTQSTPFISVHWNLKEIGGDVMATGAGVLVGSVAIITGLQHQVRKQRLYADKRVRSHLLLMPTSCSSCSYSRQIPAGYR